MAGLAILDTGRADFDASLKIGNHSEVTNSVLSGSEIYFRSIPGGSTSNKLWHSKAAAIAMLVLN